MLVLRTNALPCRLDFGYYLLFAAFVVCSEQFFFLLSGYMLVLRTCFHCTDGSILYIVGEFPYHAETAFAQ